MHLASYKSAESTQNKRSTPDNALKSTQTRLITRLINQFKQVNNREISQRYHLLFVKVS